MLLCKNCIEAIRSRGEKIIILDTIEQDIDYDETQGKWIQKYDKDELILKCEWCEEPNITLYNCD